MRLSTIFVAVLPAFALAQEEPAPEEPGTTTVISTATLTKTLTLSKVHTIVQTPGYNTTTMVTPTYSSTTSVEPTATDDNDASESTPPTFDDDNAGSALDASRVVLAGMAGMVVVAMM